MHHDRDYQYSMSLQYPSITELARTVSQTAANKKLTALKPSNNPCSWSAKMKYEVEFEPMLPKKLVNQTVLRKSCADLPWRLKFLLTVAPQWFFCDFPVALLHSSGSTTPLVVLRYPSASTTPGVPRSSNFNPIYSLWCKEYSSCLCRCTHDSNTVYTNSRVTSVVNKPVASLVCQLSRCFPLFCVSSCNTVLSSSPSCVNIHQHFSASLPSPYDDLG